MKVFTLNPASAEGRGYIDVTFADIGSAIDPAGYVYDDVGNLVTVTDAR